MRNLIKDIGNSTEISRQFLTANVLVKAASGEEQNIMLSIETSSTSALIFSFYRQNPWISRHAVITDGGENRIEIVNQRVSIVLLLQLRLRDGDKRIYHNQLSVNGGNTAHLLQPFRTYKTLKMAKERFVFLYLFFKSKGLLAFVRQCFVSLHLSLALMYSLGE